MAILLANVQPPLNDLVMIFCFRMMPMWRMTGIQDINGNSSTLTQSLNMSWKRRGSQADEVNAEHSSPECPAKDIQVEQQVKLYFPGFREGHVCQQLTGRCWSGDVPEVMPCECLVNISYGSVPLRALPEQIKWSGTSLRSCSEPLQCTTLSSSVDRYS